MRVTEILGYPVIVDPSLPPNTIRVVPHNFPICFRADQLEQTEDIAKKLMADLCDKYARAIVQKPPRLKRIIIGPDGVSMGFEEEESIA